MRYLGWQHRSHRRLALIVAFLVLATFCAPLVPVARANHSSVAGLTVSPVNFSPNNDGVADTTTISFTGTAGASGYKVRIYNSSGAQERELTATEAPDTPGSFSALWDGTTDQQPVPPNGAYIVKVLDTGDGSESAATATAEVANPPPVTAIAASPNPFSPDGPAGAATTVAVTTNGYSTASGTFKLHIHDAAGAKVAELTLTAVPGNANSYSANWNGRNSAGAKAPGGAYTLKVVDTRGGVAAAARVQGSVDLFRINSVTETLAPPGYRGARQSVTVGAQFSHPAGYILEFQDRAGRVVKSFTGENAQTMSHTWDLQLANAAIWQNANCTADNGSTNTMTVSSGCKRRFPLNPTRTVAAVELSMEYTPGQYPPTLSCRLYNNNSPNNSVNCGGIGGSSWSFGSSADTYVFHSGRTTLSAQADQIELEFGYSGRVRQVRATVLYSDGSFDLSPPDDSYSYVVKAVAANGVRAEHVPTQSLLVDTTGPTVTQFSLSLSTFGNDKTPTASISAAAGEEVTWEIWATPCPRNASSYSYYSPPIGSIQCSSSNTFKQFRTDTPSRTFSESAWNGFSTGGQPPKDAYQLWVMARDALGNPSKPKRLCEFGGDCTARTTDYYVYGSDENPHRVPTISGSPSTPNPFGGPNAGSTRVQAVIDAGTDYNYFDRKDGSYVYGIKEARAGTWKITIKPYGQPGASPVWTQEGKTSGLSYNLSQPWNGTDNNGNPVPNGDYLVLVEAWDSLGNPASQSFSTTVTFSSNAPDLTPPPNASPPGFNPRQFGTGEAGVPNSTTFSATLAESLRWKLEIRNQDGLTVRTLPMSIVPTQTVSWVWDGTTEAGAVATDGYYTWTFTVANAGGNTSQMTGDVIKGVPGPVVDALSVTPAIFGSPARPGTNFKIAFKDSAEPINWTLTLRRPTAGGQPATAVATFTGTGTVVDQSWDGGAEPDGTFEYELRATVQLPNGNQGSTVRTGQVTLDRKPPILEFVLVNPSTFDPTQTGSRITGTFQDQTDVSATVKIVPAAGGNPVFTASVSGRNLDVTWNGKVQNTNQYAQDGQYEVRITGTDAAGNVAVTQTMPLALDRSNPSLSNWQASRSAFRDTVTFTATASRPVNWTLSIRDGITNSEVQSISGPATADTAISATWDGSRSNGLKQDGTYKAVLSVRDGVGHTAATQPLTVTLDRAAPILGAVTVSPNPFSTVATFSGDVGESSFDATLVITAPASNTVIKETTARASRLNLTWNGTDNNNLAVPDGVYQYRLRITDLAGNATEVTGSVSRDRTVPRVLTRSVTPNPFDTDVSFKFQVSEPVTYELRIKDASLGVLTTLAERATPADQIEVKWDGTSRFGRAPEGKYFYDLIVTDAAGNSVSASGEMQRDFTKPVLSALAATPPDFVDQTAITARATETVNWQLKILDGAGAAVRTFSGSDSDISAVWNGSADDGTALGIGTYTLRLEAMDLAGHAATPLTGTVSRIPPAPGITDMSASQDPFRDRTTLKATLERPAQWRLEIKNQSGNQVRAYSGTGQSISQAWDGADAFGTPVPDGSYTFVLTIIGATGDPGTRTVRKDTAAPAITAVAAGGGSFSSEVTLAATVAEPELKQWRIAVTDAQGNLLREFTGTAAPVAAVWDGQDRNGTAVAPGAYLLRVEVTDRAGNTGVATGTVTRQGAAAPVIQQLTDAPDPFGDKTTIVALIVPAADWRLEIKNGSGQVLRTYTGSGALVTQDWDGRDSAGSPVADGTYVYVLTTTNTAAAATLSGTVTKAAGSTGTQQGPRILILSDNPDPFTPNGDNIGDITVIAGVLDREAEWTLVIKNTSGTVLRSSSGKDMVISQVWDGKDVSGSVVPDGTYTYTLTAKDGGTTTASATITKGTASAPGGGGTGGGGSGSGGGSGGGTGGAGGTGGTGGTGGEGGTGSGGGGPTNINVSGGGTSVTVQTGAKGPEVNVTSLTVGPNPTRSSVTITATITENASWTFAIRDEAGSEVKTASGSGAAVSVTWDGKKNGQEAPDGLYTFTIVATNSRGSAAASGQFRKDNTARIFGFAVVPGSFSPNGDGVLDRAQFSAELDENAPWQVQIAAEGGMVVRNITGQGLRVSATWEGTDDMGLPVSDGVYTARVVAQDAVGNRSTAGVQVRVDNTAPAAPRLKAPATAKDDVALTWESDADKDPSGLFRFEVWRQSGDRREKVADVAPAVRSHMDKSVPIGIYQYSVRAVDRAGNGASSQPATVRVMKGEGACDIAIRITEYTECTTPDKQARVQLPPNASTDGGFLALVSGPADAAYPAGSRVQVGPLVQVEVTSPQGSPLKLQRPLQVTMRYDPSRVHDARQLRAYVWREDRQDWYYLGGTVDLARQEISFFLNRSGRVAALVDPDLPIFTDIDGHWAMNDINGLAGHRITRGYPDGTFRPDNQITRAEFITFLVRAIHLQPRPGARLTSPDRESVPEWAAPALLAATEAGIIKGFEDGTLRPQQPITRSEMMVIVVRALGLESRTLELRSKALPFQDDDQVPFWARGHLALVTSLGDLPFLQGGNFEPTRPATRAETAWTVMMLLDRIGY